MVEILKLIGNENRIRILHLLYHNGQTCVCQLEEGLSLNQSNLSRHLIKLKKRGLIIAEKRSPWVDYSISEVFLKEHPYLKEILERVDEEIFNEDLERMRRINC